MPRPVIQAADGVVFASHVAGATRQLLAGKIGSGTVAWHLQVEGSSLAQVCHSRYHSETLCTSGALPENADRDSMHPQVQICQRTLITTVCTLRCRSGCRTCPCIYTQATPDIERRANDAFWGRETSSPCAAP